MKDLLMRLAVIPAVLLVMVGMAFADVPQLINVQGKLTNAAGEPVADGDYNVEFAIYTVPTSRTAEWTETRTVTVADGLFSIALGEVSPMSLELFENEELYLGIQVEGDPEMTPRQRLTTAPYAFAVAGSAAAGGWVDDGTVVRLESATDSVGIGTVTPSSELHVVGHATVDASGANGYGLEIIGDGDYEPSLRINGPGQAWNVVVWSDGSLRFVKSTGSTFSPLILKNTSFSYALVASDNGVGIGTADPQEMLQVEGTVHSTSGGYKFPDGTVQTTAAVYGGPLAYGVVTSSGSLVAGTPNVTDVNLVGNIYIITIDGENYHYQDYVTTVTPASSTPYMAGTSSGSGKLNVYLWDTDGTPVQANFHFVVYKPQVAVKE
jgi:hypothetical protein